MFTYPAPSGRSLYVCMLSETLRKHPPMGWLDRIAAADYPITDKLTIPRGTPVYVNAIGMHYDPQYFPDPHVFNPDRFLPENEGSIVPFSYMPFGDGPRMCIGKFETPTEEIIYKNTE